MKNYSQNVKIRILIMLIALLGGIGFLCYVIFNASVANENENRIAELQNTKLPVLEKLTYLKRDIERVHQSFSTALVFENQFLLEDAQESANTYTKRIYDIIKLDKSAFKTAQKLQTDFDNYYQSSKAVANLLIHSPDNSRKYEDEIHSVNQKRIQVINLIDQAIDSRKFDFVESLAETHGKIVIANTWGASMGGLLILGLIILSWCISVIVIKAVNKSNQLKEVFLNTMSHELRTPINGISGALSLLESTPLTEEQIELIEACQISEQSITTSVDDILEFSGMISGKIKIAQRPFCLNTVINNTAKIFSSDLESKGIELNIHYDETFNPDTNIIGDEQRLSHGLRHIIGNAVKFSNSGKIHIHISSAPHIKKHDNKVISLCVTDDGPGIPQTKLKDIFEPFQQIDGSFSRQHQGIGIGIPMVSNIAKAMGGSLKIKNRDTSGLSVVFQFIAPIVDQLEKDVPTIKPSIIPSTDIYVLIVEDNEVNQLVLKAFVEKMGYRSQSAFNGQEAVELVSSQDFSIILMDCQMPVMNGFDATRAIRALPNGKTIPIIAVTANAMEGDRERCINAGMNDYLKKPLSMLLLRNTMNEYLFYSSDS